MFGSKPLCHTTRLENAGEQIMFGSTTIVLHWPNIIRVLGQGESPHQKSREKK